MNFSISIRSTSAVRKHAFCCAAAGVLLVSAFMAGGCRKHGSADLPSDFDEKTDAQKVEWLMSATTPDSVARFICRASIGEHEDATIKSLSQASLYAYEHYTGEDLSTFQIAYDEYVATLPLAPKMKLLYQAGQLDPIGMGYQLGLEYVGQIREQKKSVQDIESEIAEFKRACGKDQDTYDRFITGFHTALEADHGQDLSEEVYRRFINYK